MVVIRFLGEEWDADEKIVVSIPDNKPMYTNDSRIAQALEVDSLVGWCIYHTDGKPPNKVRFTIPIDKNKVPQAAGISNGCWLYVRRADLATQIIDRENWAKELQRREDLKLLEKLKFSDPAAYKELYEKLFPKPKRPGTACKLGHDLVFKVIEDIPREGLIGMQYDERKCGLCDKATPKKDPVWFCEECIYELCVPCRNRVFMYPPERDEPKPRTAIENEFDTEWGKLQAQHLAEYQEIFDREEEMRKLYGPDWYNNAKRLKEQSDAEDKKRQERLEKEDAERAHQIMLDRMNRQREQEEFERDLANRKETEERERQQRLEEMEKTIQEKKKLNEEELERMKNAALSSSACLDMLLSMVKSREEELSKREQLLTHRESFVRAQEWSNRKQTAALQEEKATKLLKHSSDQPEWLSEAHTMLHETRLLGELLITRNMQAKKAAENANKERDTAAQQEINAIVQTTTLLQKTVQEQLSRQIAVMREQQREIAAQKEARDRPVVEWLKQHGMEVYGDIFSRNEVDLRTLSTLCEDDFAAMGILAVGVQRKLMKATEQLRVQYALEDHGLEYTGTICDYALLNPSKQVCDEHRDALAFVYQRHDPEKLHHLDLIFHTFSTQLGKLSNTLMSIYNIPKSIFTEIATEVLSAAAPHHLPMIQILLYAQDGRELEWLERVLLNGQNDRGNWSEHMDADGNSYYFNRVLNASQWIYPECLRVTEEQRENILAHYEKTGNYREWILYFFSTIADRPVDFDVDNLLGRFKGSEKMLLNAFRDQYCMAE
eukprot:PhF_6_TR40186/c0_g1_i1/m.59610